MLAKQEATRKAHETALLTGAPVAPTPAAAPRRLVQMPDEYLPPNKILFVQNLPDDTTKESLEGLFKPFVFFPSPIFTSQRATDRSAEN